MENHAEQIQRMVCQMTFTEKAAMLTGLDDVHTMPLPRFGIPARAMVDGPHGVRLDQKYNCTHFPSLCCLAASWDVETAEKMGAALAAECRRVGIDLLLAPGVNLKRTPLCGRNFEYFSEDPVVTGELAAAYIRGVQENGVGCSLKHFAVNNQEKYRIVINAEVEERTLRELYLKPFEIAVRKAKPEAVMCAFNKVNGIWCSENRFLLTEILRQEWGYEDMVVSDWGAVHDSARAVCAGLDWQMPANREIVEELQAALEAGEVTMAQIDACVERVLRFALKERPEGGDYDRAAQHQTAKEIAAAGMVLLKNERNALPLTAEKYKKIAVIGEFAQSPLTGGQGSAEVNPLPDCVDSPMEALKALLPQVEFTYRQMYGRSSRSETMVWPELVKPEFLDFVSQADAVLVFAGSMTGEDTEMFDRRTIELDPVYERVLDAAAEHGKQVILVLQTGSAVALDRISHAADAIVEMWLGGEAAGSAVAEVLCGTVNPSGKLPETFPNGLRRDLDYPGNGRYVEYREKLEVGYRYYDHHPEEICYPFGHGLSYTTFAYAALQVIQTETGWQVSLRLKNTGTCDGAEVVQLYVSDPVSIVPKPVKELKQFQKVFLQAGEEREVVLELTEDDLAYYNVSLHQWTVENGLYRLLIGASSQDIRLEAEIEHDGPMAYSIRKKGDAMVGDTSACFG